MKPYFKGLSAPRKGLMGVGVTDVLAADFLRRFTVADVAAGQKDPERLQPLRYFSWGAMTIWMVWQSASMLGIALAHLIPPDWGLEFIATLALFAMLMPMMTDRASMLCVLVAGAVSLVFVQLPLNLGLLISVVLGVAAAMLVDSRRGRPKGLSS
jgi:predicted branched-subunit amino acid permease